MVTSTLTKFDLWASSFTILMLAAMFFRWRINKRWETILRTVAQANLSDLDIVETQSIGEKISSTASRYADTPAKPLAILPRTGAETRIPPRVSRKSAGIGGIPQPPRPLKFELGAPRQARPGAIVDLHLTISIFSKSLEQEIARSGSDYVPALVASFSVGSRIIVTLSGSVRP